MSKCKDFGHRVGDVRIDRATRWGNPFKLTEFSRHNSILMYEEYFVKNLLKDLDDIKDARRLGCHCAPLECHGDVIKRYLDERGF